MTLPIPTDKIVSGSGLGGSIIAILLIFFMGGEESNGFSLDIAELDKKIEVHIVSSGHSTALLNYENLKDDIDKIEDDFKDEFKIINEKLDKNYRILCQISNGDCK